jgi:hypothetical protein
VLQLLVAANVLPSFLILFILMMEAIHSSVTSILTRTTRHQIQEDGIHHCKNHFGDKRDGNTPSTGLHTREQ